ncbi:MAG TPA: DedA family protein [Chitinophagales bacterium]|nr:DedA family protein [Chitinophagales bacterium]
MKHFFLILFSVMASTMLYGQATISGTVTDEAQQPISGATIIVEGTDVKVNTDEHGNFSFESNSIEKKNIKVEYKGYKSVEMDASVVENGLNVQLEPKNYILQLVDFILHIDDHLADFLQDFGPWVYAILFLIIFVETGVVVMPFLPGDSLLFATGMLAAQYPESLNVWIVIGLLLVAAILGDTLNYTIGKEFGNQALKVKIFGKNFVKEDHINKTHEFYHKYGSKTIVIARFVPIVRTLAPFVAGIGRMAYSTFITYNVIGAMLWVIGITLAGYFLGNIPIIRENFEKVVLGIIFVSVLPMVFAFVQEKMKSSSPPSSN